MCNFLEYKGASCPVPWGAPLSSLARALRTYPLTRCLSIDTKIVYRRYASLFFIAGCDAEDNELITLEIIHRYVEQMDKYYGNVCELDIIFSFTKAYYILDEILLAGELQESSKKNVLRCISQQDSLEDMEVRIWKRLFRSFRILSFRTSAALHCPALCPVACIVRRLLLLSGVSIWMSSLGTDNFVFVDIRLRTRSPRSCRGLKEACL